METVFMLHSHWRWIVLLAAVLALVGSVVGRSNSRAGWASKMGLFYTIALDLQVLFGLILYVMEGAWSANAFIAYVHPVVMLAALGVAHVGRGRDRRTGAGAGLLFYLISIVLVVLAIPSWSM